MRILLDKSVPVQVRGFLPNHTVSTAAAEGWDRLSNGALLNAVESAGFDVFVTADQNIQHQQNLLKRKVAIVVISTNRLTALQTNPQAITQAVDAATPNSYQMVNFPRPPRRRNPYPPIP